MTITTVHTKIIDYIAETQTLMVAVKTNVCKKSIDEYPPVAVSLARAPVPYDVDSAVKQVIASSYMMLVERHLIESKTNEMLEEINANVQAIIQQEQSWIVGVDIPSPIEYTLEGENSIPSTVDTDVRVI